VPPSDTCHSTDRGGYSLATSRLRESGMRSWGNAAGRLKRQEPSAETPKAALVVCAEGDLSWSPMMGPLGGDVFGGCELHSSPLPHRVPSASTAIRVNAFPQPAQVTPPPTPRPGPSSSRPYRTAGLCCRRKRRCDREQHLHPPPSLPPLLATTNQDLCCR